MQLEVITPDRLLFKGDVNYVQLPGIGGSFGVLSQHAPMVSALKKGMVTVEQDQAMTADDIEQYGEYSTSLAREKRFSFEVNGGVVEVLNDKVIILAE